jgi:hypothetical protein
MVFDVDSTPQARPLAVIFEVDLGVNSLVIKIVLLIGQLPDPKRSSL